jgi:hypothetical protein
MSQLRRRWERQNESAEAFLSKRLDQRSPRLRRQAFSAGNEYRRGALSYRYSARVAGSRLKYVGLMLEL